jgi:hypothetical protein
MPGAPQPAASGAPGAPGGSTASSRSGPAGAVRALLRSPDSRPALVGAAAAVVLAVAYLAAPLMGGDLSAQMARTEFTRDHPFAMVDLRWFGGALPFGYTLWTAFAMALLGVRVVGALAMVISTVLTVRLLQRAGARRPVWGALAAAVCQASNLAEGRVTFACGMACGLGALLALRPGADTRRGLWTAAILAALAGAASPVAAMLLWLCAGALVLCRHVRPALVIAIASAVPTAVMVVVFSDGGPQPFNEVDAARAAVASLLVAALAPRRNGLVVTGALLGFVMVLLAFWLDTPVGGNAMRLTLLFAVPVIVALVDTGPVLAAGAAVLAVAVQSPVTVGTLAGAGKPQTEVAYYEPMIDAVRGQGPLTGRVQIPELNGHWEAVFAARELPLARGWLRQADTKLNSDPFYGHPLNDETYRRWLDLNGVQFVAVAQARLTHTGNRERDYIRQEQPGFLDEVWSNDDWTLYAVQDHTAVADAPAQVLAQNPTSLVLEVPAGAEVTVRVRPFRWLTLEGPDGACLELGDRWITVRGGDGGRTTIRTDQWPGGDPARC